MTICKICWVDKDDTKENWYFHSWKRHWLKCKQCLLEWRKSEYERVMARERDKKRYENDINRRMYIFKRNLKARDEKWYWWVHSKTERRISKLKLRPNVCPICWYEWRIISHHPDINIWNEIVFCCQICHDKIHRNKIECPKPLDLLAND